MFILSKLFIGTLICSAAVSAYARQEPQENSSDGKPTLSSDDEPMAFFHRSVQPILERRCLPCHGNNPHELGGQLALLSRESVLQGGDTGPAVNLENPSESLLLDAINYGVYEMPPDGKLPPAEIGVLTRWIEIGLPWPVTAERRVQQNHSTPQIDEQSKSFWSFQPVRRPAIPAVQDESWPINDVDRFILATLEKHHLKPALAASKQALIRRLYYDLWGLPPSYQDVVAFVNNQSENAYRDWIDRLLAAPQYGEKWGRHWLDIVRYAESNSFERDSTKPFVWRYRDYVIRSFNEDKPYNQFLVEQLAGDELLQPTSDSIVATGYYRLGQWDDEPADPKQALYDDLDDILATTTQAMFGLTVNCARCHDHKIDPISTEDYYRLLAFFRNVRRYGDRSDESVLEASSRQLTDHTQSDPLAWAEYEQNISQRQLVLSEIESIAQQDFEPVEHQEFMYLENRELLMRKRLENGVLTEEQFRQYLRTRDELQRMKENPPNMYRVLCVKEQGSQCPPTHILIRGNPHVPGKLVEPGFLSVLSPSDPILPSHDLSQSTGRRWALAHWIASPEHPLTPRVMVNRIWQYHFGRGLVRSANDFGFQGDRPTHPELLDYLADEFIQGGWSVKKIHRLILQSKTYQMGGQYDPQAYSLDPINNYFWRFDMRRLTAEEIRDSILAVSGRLNRDTFYGPSIFTRISDEVLAGQSMPGVGWGNSTELDSRRRSIYIHVKRSLLVPLLNAFDAADTDVTCPVRFNTTQPTQALSLMNSDFIHHEAAEFAELVRQQHPDVDDQIREILQRVLQRAPTDAELQLGADMLVRWKRDQGLDSRQVLTLFCLTAFNLNEFIFLE